MSDSKNWSVTFEELSENDRPISEYLFELNFVRECDLHIAIKKRLKSLEIEGFMVASRISHEYDGHCLKLETKKRKARAFITEKLF